MIDVLLQLGGFTFAVQDVAPQTIGRSTSYRWAWVEKMQAMAAGQFTGPGEDTISLDGTYYPEFVSSGFTLPFSADPLKRLRDLAALGLPVPLVDGLGNNLGQWVILAVTQTGGPFYTQGVARKIDFTVSLRKWGT